MILTSYFGRRKLKSSGLTPVAISLVVPKSFHGKRYMALTPTKHMADLLLEGNTDKFSQLYTTEILAWLDPVKVYEELDGCALLSTEKSGAFSHRRLVAEWLEKGTGKKVNEL